MTTRRGFPYALFPVLTPLRNGIVWSIDEVRIGKGVSDVHWSIDFSNVELLLFGGGGGGGLG